MPLHAAESNMAAAGATSDASTAAAAGRAVEERIVGRARASGSGRVAEKHCLKRVSEVEFFGFLMEKNFEFFCC